ncbi:histidine ammonia-lyase [Thermosipho melanesiensis]|uniref:Histidine ammonia-lyase n=1 Tax=Thermosipho melanesiensis TaxID=46541 RepID=A0ABM6GGX8_9BACT|nr:histidine ammonia-lyase [Thermosipho melanesiensis]APT74643.1 histidine ammonia-lyase [Thermosipho melanesiensis]OOC35140.1 histidine ammonia-lyase [Thermosipho melanesiensis]OOC35350.1 histidine ammonia-lyase [Thermosipho melanesiensis]OOC36601.1 histidine ammonia-lyase [Thermosipho melanesiensis]OOC39922.1 histidine ammonia-lyase [Thermosipho melanesiensis]
MVKIDGNTLTIDDVHNVARNKEDVTLDPEAKLRIEKSRENIEKILKDEKPVYGVNTGFGALVNVRISKEELAALQRNIVLSHAAGIGKSLEPDVIRAMMLLRANSLAKGFSGVRPLVIEKLIEFLNKDVVPFVPEMGSVGASGDLAPLSHIAMALIGEGYIMSGNKKIKTKQFLDSKGIKPLVLREKEGLSLLNGTQFMTSILSLLVRDMFKLIEVATLVAAGAVDVLLGTPKAYDERIQLARNHKGQIYIAKLLRDYLSNSELRESHIDCGNVQDAYTLRTIPQVYGAVYDILEFAKSVVENEINAATDNPLIFDGEVISGGNFHGEPVALVCDYLSIALTDMGNMIERRIDRLVNPMVNRGLAPFLATGKEGLNSGYMIWQYTAAAICNENKVLSHPATSDTIPTSAYQEDHVSMGATAARKLKKIYSNLINLISIEAMLVKVALELRRPLKSSEKVEKFFEKIEIQMNGDRYFGDDFNNVKEKIILEVER